MSKIKIVQILLTGGIVLVLNAHLNAQITGENVEIIKNFDARLLETDRLKVTPLLPPVDTTPKMQTYNINVKTSDVDYLPPKLRPLGIKTVKEEKGFNGYTKLGYGVPASPYGELAYSLSKAKQMDLGLYLRHHSAKLKSNPLQRFSETGGALNGTYYHEPLGMGIGATIGYNHDNVFYYGYNKEVDTLTLEQGRQRYNLFDINARVFNSQQTVGDFDYRADIHFYRLTDKYAAGESGFDLNIGGSKWIADRHTIDVKLITDLTSFSDTAGTQSLTNIKLQPAFTFRSDIFKIRLGLNLISFKDEFYPQPDIEANLAIAGSALSAYAGWKGDFVKNNMRSLTEYNPFVHTGRLDINNNQTQRYYGGIKGNMKIFEYQVEAGYAKNKNLALFLTDGADLRRRFLTVYDTVNIFNINGTLTASPMENLTMLVTANQNFFTTTTQDKPWHLPRTELNVGLRYAAMEKKLHLKGDLFLQDGLAYKDEGAQIGNLNALLDLSLGAEYWMAENIGLFVDANNLLNNKRERWYRYPTYGINIIGGITARF